MFLEGKWDVDALMKLGAKRVRQLEDGVDVTPDIDTAGYDAALVEAIKDRLKVYAANKRWEREIAGTTADLGTGPIPVPTDREGRASLKQARDMLRDGELLDGAGNVRTDVEMVMGSFVAKVDDTALTKLIKAAGQHVQDAFSRHAQVLADIEAGVVTTTDGVDAAFA